MYYIYFLFSTFPLATMLPNFSALRVHISYTPVSNDKLLLDFKLSLRMLEALPALRYNSSQKTVSFILGLFFLMEVPHSTYQPMFSSFVDVSQTTTKLRGIELFYAHN